MKIWGLVLHSDSTEKQLEHEGIDLIYGSFYWEIHDWLASLDGSRH